MLKPTPRGVAVSANGEEISDTYGMFPLQFEENLGQASGPVKYLSRGIGYTLFLTPTEAVLSLAKPSAKRIETRESEKVAAATPVDSPTILKLQLREANAKPEVVGEEELSGRNFYFKGQGAQQWHAGVQSFKRIRYKEVYPGIDLVYYGNQRQLEYDFVVSPGAKPEMITLGFEGADNLEVDEEGNLSVHCDGGKVIQRRPIIYQETRGVMQEVAGSYVIRQGREVIFEVGEYDPSKPLIIDPILHYSTYIGGHSGDEAYDIAVDGDGNAYVTGYTSSADYPLVGGGNNISHSGDIDVLVSKLNPAGTALVYSTIIGGSGRERGDGIALDSQGNAYVTGRTNSANFATTSVAFDRTHNGGYDAFVFKLDTNGALAYSTYLGGSTGAENGQYDGGDFYAYRQGDIAVDAAGNAYVTGSTTSLDFPVTPNAFQPNSGGGITCHNNPACDDAFVAKLSADGSNLIYSSYLGAASVDKGTGISVDAAGNAYVTGQAGVGFPTTPGAFRATDTGGIASGFVTKVNPQGTAKTYSTLVGDSGGVNASGSGLRITVDAVGQAYVVGDTGSSGYPTTPGAYRTTKDYRVDIFVTKLNASGSALVFSTFYARPGRYNDYAGDIAVNPSGNVYITGTWVSCVNESCDNPRRGVIAEFTPDGSALVGEAEFYAYKSLGIGLDDTDNVYVTGFDWAALGFTIGTSHNTVVFIDKFKITPTISGQVTDGNSGVPLEGVTVALEGEERAMTKTDANGRYCFANVPAGGNYTVTPSLQNFLFTPVSRQFASIDRAKTANFTAAPAGEAPVVVLTSPTDGENFNPSSVISISATASAPTGRTLTKIDYYLNGSLLTTKSYDPLLPFSFNYGPLEPGLYTLMAVAFDNTGASTTSAPVNFTSKPSAPAPTPTPGPSPEADNFQLSQSSYSCTEAIAGTSEGFATLNIDVIRSNASTAATVEYFTQDASGGNECNQVTGKASQRCDYTAQAGTLRFAPGETTKQIHIPIISDGYAEGDELFLLKLQNPMGPTLGVSQATIIIHDSGTVTTSANNPYLNNSFFVSMNYADFLSREPDADGFTDWAGVLNSCGPEKGFLGAPRNCDRAHVSHGFFGSPEFTGRGFLIYRMYEVGMNRLPRYAEFTLEMASLSGFGLSNAIEHQNLSYYLRQFTSKQEFQNRFVGALQVLEAEQLILKLEQTAGVRLADTATTRQGQPPQFGRQELINKRANGEFTVGETLKAFVEQQVVYDKYFPRAFVTMEYFAYLKRDPDLNDPDLVGWKDWVEVFTNGGAHKGRPDILHRDYHHLIFGFIYSEEYRKRFGAP